MTGGGALIRGLDLAAQPGDRAADPRRRGSAHLCRARHGPDPRRRGEVLVRPVDLRSPWRGPPAAGTRVDTVVLAACLIASLLARRPAGRDAAVACAGAVRETFVAPLVALQVQAERARGAFVVRDITRRPTRQPGAPQRASCATLELENERLRALLGLGARLRAGIRRRRGAAPAASSARRTPSLLTAGARPAWCERSAGRRAGRAGRAWCIERRADDAASRSSGRTPTSASAR